MKFFRTSKGSWAVQIGQFVYRLTGGGVEFMGAAMGRGRQYGFAEGGQYGKTMQTYVRACERLGISVRYGYRGILNELGDMGDVFPAVKPWTLPLPECWIEADPANYVVPLKGELP